MHINTEMLVILRMLLLAYMFLEEIETVVIYQRMRPSLNLF
jgi:hypothetical protein